MKAKIGISWLLDEKLIREDKRSLAYIKSIEKAGAEVIYLPLIKSEKEALDLLETIDGLLMSGGEDINPTLYNEENLYCEEYIDERDTSDLILLKCAIKKDIPVLCICRGMQILNIVQGGSLYQDLNSQRPTDVVHRDPNKEVYVKHLINVVKDSLLYKAINSNTCCYNGWHHQAVKDLGKGLRVTAFDDKGGIEAIELINAKYVLGVQFHPERYMVEEAEDASKLFENFVSQCL